MQSTMIKPNQSQGTTQKTLSTKLPIGQLLKEAGLISEMQLQLVLQNQATSGYEELKLGEILALRGWVKQETTDFFASRWESVIAAARLGSVKRRIGDYLCEAHLLTNKQVEEVLQYQKENKMLFGHAAVSKGYLKQETIDFFIRQLLTVSRSQSKVDRHIKRAQGCLQSNNVSEAILELREALKLEPNNGQGHAWLAQSYFLENQMSLAKIHLKKAMQVSPNDELVKALSAKISVAEVCSSPSSPAIANKNAKNIVV